MQKQIEKSVTNGIGYRESSGYALRRLDEALKYGMALSDTELDLQMHLGGLDAITAESDFARNFIWEQVFALGEIAGQLSTYGIRGNIKTPEDVSSLIQGYFMRKSMEKAEQDRGLNPIDKSQFENFYSPKNEIVKESILERFYEPTLTR